MIETSRDVSAAALAVLVERGWHQGGYLDFASGAVCMEGAGLLAIGSTITIDDKGRFTVTCGVVSREMWGLYLDWHRALCRRLFQAGVVNGATPNQITAYNDDPTTTYEDVVLLLKRHQEGS